MTSEFSLQKSISLCPASFRILRPEFLTVELYYFVTGKFDLGVPNEAGQRLTEFSQEKSPVIANILFQQHKGRL